MIWSVTKKHKVGNFQIWFAIILLLRLINDLYCSLNQYEVTRVAQKLVTNIIVTKTITSEGFQAAMYFLVIFNFPSPWRTRWPLFFVLLYLLRLKMLKVDSQKMKVSTQLMWAIKRFMILARISSVFYISLFITLNLIGQLGNTNIDQDSFTSYFPLIGYMQVLRNILSMKYYLRNLQILIIRMYLVLYIWSIFLTSLKSRKYRGYSSIHSSQNIRSIVCKWSVFSVTI